jgi:hypothetical protein
MAAAADRVEIADRLIAAGAKVDARTTSDFTPLHWSASRGSVETARALIAAGADVDARTSLGVTPLHWAANKGHVEMLTLLLRAGADAEARTADGLTPLHWAVMGKSTAATELLALKKVTEDLARAPAPPEPGPSAPPVAATEPPSASSVQVVNEAPFGRTLFVDIGLGEKLVFVWIEPMSLWVGKFEVTNGQFRRFRLTHDSGRRENFQLNESSQPVANVSWHDATAFAEWLNTTRAASLPANMRARLPTSTEWAAFAMCGRMRTYPWGSEWPPRYGNFSDLAARRELSEWVGIQGYDDGFPVSCPVERSGANEWGLYGVGGNVWEWCQDASDLVPGTRVRMGGGWDFDREPSLRIASVGFDRPEVRADSLGFRLVLSLPH